MGMSKLTCTLKGVAPLEWLLDEDVSPMGIAKGFGQIYPSSCSFFTQGIRQEIF